MNDVWKRVRRPFHRKPGRQPRTSETTAMGKPRDHKGAIDKRTDPLTVQAICVALEMGSTYRQAAVTARISESTIHRWMAEGEVAPEGTVARKFWESAKIASGEAVFRCVKFLSRLAKKDWRVAAWLLSKRGPNEWGPPETRVASRDERMTRPPLRSRRVIRMD